MNYSIRRLKRDDLKLMKDLNVLFADVFDDQENYQSSVPSDLYLTKFLEGDNNIVLCAIENDAVIGGLVAYSLTKFEMERKEVYIYDLAVANEHQRKGVGRQLIRVLKDIARDDGAYVVFVQADEGDDAVKFYESLNPDENLRTRNFDYLI